MVWTVDQTTTNEMADDFNTSQALKYNNRQERLTVFGDSISAAVNCFGRWFARSSKDKVVFLENAGIGGNTTNDMVLRMDDVPEGTTLVTVMEAVNDASQGVTLEQHGANIKLILETMLQRGIKPIMVMAPPSDTPAHTQYINSANLIDFVTATNLNIAVVDIWSQFIDPSTGGWISGASEDGTHPSAGTEKTAGLSLAENWSNGYFYTPLSRDNSIGVNDNSCFLDDGNADNTPDNWVLGGGSISSTLSETSLGLGNTWGVEWTNTSGLMYSDNFTVNSGDTYLFTIRVSTLTTSGTGEFSVFIDNGGGTRQYMVQDAKQDIDPTTLSVIYKVPDGVTDARIVVSCDAGTYDMTVNLAQAQYFNITQATV